MAKDSSRSSVRLDVQPGAARPPARELEETPFRILVIADFSGRENRGQAHSLEGRRPLQIDRDNFDDVFRGLKPALNIGSLHLDFEELEDFHPDRLFSRIPAFSSLDAGSAPPPPPEKRSMNPAPPLGFVGRSVLDDILAQSPEPSSTQLNPPDDWNSFLKDITAPHLEPRPDATQRDAAARLDSRRSELMRAVLHHPAFQKLEAAWRGLRMLVERLDTDGLLRIHLMDASLDELMSDDEMLARVLLRKDDPWAVVIGDFAFGQAARDVSLLTRLARLAASARAPFIGEAMPPGEDASEEFEAFRRASDACWVGLAMPRFLLRLPYGAQTSSVESFPFEEMPESDHASYLWGNPAFCCAYLLGQAFLSDGWEMSPGRFRHLENLPLHTYRLEGDVVAKPCAEVLLSEKQVEFIMDQGYMALASMKNSDAAMLVRFQSVAQPATALAGRWAGRR